VLTFGRNPEDLHLNLPLPEMVSLAVADPHPAFVALWALTRVLILLFIVGAAQRTWQSHRRLEVVLANRREVIARLRAQSLY
jgi:hypothetical protein